MILKANLFVLSLVAALLALLGMQKAWAKSNIIVIQTDDMPARLLKAAYIHADGSKRPVLPKITAEIFQKGAFFSNVHAATPLCAPSRAALLTGRFSHNTRLTENNPTPYGGWPGWQASAFYNKNLATSLQAEGYKTAHFGKFLNNYAPGANAPLSNPPGWDRWVSDATDESTRDFYGYKLLEDGFLTEPFGTTEYQWDRNIDPASCSFLREECNYHTDKMTFLAAKEIKEASSPFYLQIDYHTPHGDSQPPAGPQPATRHIGTVRDPLFEKTPNYNEKNILDKPAVLRRQMGRITPWQEKNIIESQKRAIEALQSVDEGVGHLIDTLRETDQLDNTYIFFFSDNGYFRGEHRFTRGKFLPHRPSSLVPVAVLGPDALPLEISAPLSSLDVTASILSVAGASLPNQEGRSLRPLWRGETLTQRAILTEYLLPAQLDGEEDGSDPPPFQLAPPAIPSPSLRYRSLLIYPYRYTSYQRGGFELYNLQKDPFEMSNLAYTNRHQKTLLYMREELRNIAGCKGSQCLAKVPKDE